MNQQRRREIDALRDELDLCLDRLGAIESDEEDYRDNIPENLESSERYIKSDESIDWLNTACESLEETIISLGEIE